MEKKTWICFWVFPIAEKNEKKMKKKFKYLINKIKSNKIGQNFGKMKFSKIKFLMIKIF